MWDVPGSGIELMSPALAGGFFTTEPPGSPALYLGLILYGIEVTNRKKKKRKKNSFLIPCGSMVRRAGSNNAGKVMPCPHFSDFNKYFSERRPACLTVHKVIADPLSSILHMWQSSMEMADNPQPFFI